MAAVPTRVVEAPLYSYPLEELLWTKFTAGVEIWLYGGYPDSPLNGGRNNFLLDGRAAGKPFTETSLAEACAAFWATVEEANRSGIPFLLAFTNLFCTPGELTRANLGPLERLAASGARHQVRNGVIINSALLEMTVRARFADALTLVASCTKYVRPDRLLSPPECCEALIRDARSYDHVTITPQLSRNREALERIARECPDQAIAIANAYCAESCNSYHHYAFTSQQNKIPLARFDAREEAAKMAAFAREHSDCPALQEAQGGARVRDNVCGQLAAGIRHFKVGRGIGQDCLDELAGLIREFDGAPGSRASQAPPAQPIPGFLYPGEGERFRCLAAGLMSKSTILEIGVLAGLSTSFWAKGAQESGSTVHAIDPFDHDIAEQRRHHERSASACDADTPAVCLEQKCSRDEVARLLDSLDLHGAYRLIEGYSDEVARSWELPLHILFLDGDHNHSAVRRDFVEWAPWLVPGGLVVVHDSNMGMGPSRHGFFGPTRVVEEFLTDPSRWKIVERFAATTVARKLQ